uniref:Sam68 tyrosine-rich domain-containing protein n=1 Tax=Salarias fasciatus TaxID=181472 RepID=A0A672IFK0_SALFA
MHNFPNGDTKKYLDIISNKNIKLSERVLIPVQQYPKGYDDGYGGEYDDESYEAYEDNYSNQSKRGHYTSSAFSLTECSVFMQCVLTIFTEEWPTTRPCLKAPILRLTRGGYRKHPYGRY